MPPAELQNPFLVHQIDASDRLPPGDVPELHIGIVAKCEANIAQTRHSGQSLGLLIVGEAGSGKSHMIARLRRNLVPDTRAILAAITLHGAFAGRLWRHVRERLVSELLREVPSEVKGTNGLLRILHNRFPKWAAAAPSLGFVGTLIGKSKTSGTLHPHLEEFAKHSPLDYAFMKVLPKFVEATELSPLARSWLRGEQLSTADLARLGLPPASQTDLEQEQAARKIVLSLLELAGTSTTVVLCFDQVESLQAGTLDAMSMRQFATLANELISMPGPRVVMTFIRPTHQIEMQKAVEIANMQRIAQDRASIPPLTWEQCARLVRNRLEAEPTCHLARQDHADDPDWPLGNAFLEKTFRENRRDLTPRHLIMACRNEFDRSRNRTVSSEAPPPDPPRKPSEDTPTPTPRTNALDSSWERKRQRHSTKLQGIPFEQVMAIGLPWLVEATALPFERLHEISGDVNLLFRPTGRTTKPLAISFCNHEPQSLWRRLDRIKKQWESTKGRDLGSFVVLRYQGERTTPNAQQRLAGLSAAGVRVLLMDGQQLAELASYQQMLTMAHDGDIVIDGRPVDIGVFNEWAKAHLTMTSAVKEFLDTVFEPDGKKAAKPAKVSAARI